MRTQYLSYFTGFRPGCQAISQRFETFETDSPPSNVPSPHIPRSMVRTSNPLVGDGLACPARGGGAIPAHLGAMAGISHLDTDCHTSDIGHWFAMTLFSIACQKSVGSHFPIRCSNKPPAAYRTPLSLRAGAHTGVAIRPPLQCSTYAHPPTKGSPFQSRRRGRACLSRAGKCRDSGEFGRNGTNLPLGYGLPHQ